MRYHYFADDLGTDVVVLRVGHDRQEFIVHKKLLASQGKVVNLIVSKKTVTEAGQNVITFERDDPDVFRLLVGWLYRGHIPRAEPYIDKPDYAESINRSAPGPSLPDLSFTTDEDVAMASGDQGMDQDTSNDEKCAQPACTQKESREGFPSGLPLRDKKTTRACTSDPLTRERPDASKFNVTAKYSTQNKKETTRETLAELPMDLTTWERATEPETPDLVSGSSATPSLPSTPRFDYPRTITLLEQAIEEADQHQMALVQLIAVAERLY
ncbi:hypothetical protein NEMBOFW57_002626 [Staphylotrichum longicolle]|uniref:BTB domain-containing protein n=1 Tax=Staphylotrichum longicolle TaxID=669026 RepID=A0AAD4I2M8_9PEZI|nr:hypothetical protein NEMBOFW57_002626 [Staphylotrichum longicolle]